MRHPNGSRRSDVGRLQALLRDQQETVRNTTLYLWPLVYHGYGIHPYGKVWDQIAEGVLLEDGDIHSNSGLPSLPAFTAPYQCVLAAMTLRVQSQSQSQRSARGGAYESSPRARSLPRLIEAAAIISARCSLRNTRTWWLSLPSLADDTILGIPR